MRLKNDREMASFGIAMMVAAVIVATAVSVHPGPYAMTVTAISGAMILMASGVLAVAGTVGLTRRRDRMAGLIVPGAAWGMAGIIACCAPWPIMIALHRSIGPASVPLAVIAALCGTAGAILAGRWADLAINTPSEADMVEERSE